MRCKALALNQKYPQSAGWKTLTVSEVLISPERKIVLRIAEHGGKEFLDIRTYIESARFTGFSDKGVNIPLEKGFDLREALNSVFLQHSEMVLKESIVNKTDQ
jgi:hypothetical protein